MTKLNVFKKKSNKNQLFAGLTDFADAAHRWLDAGYQPVAWRIHAQPNGTKKALPFKWKEKILSITHDDVPKFFGSGCVKISIRSGIQNGGLVNIDLDSHEAVQLAPRLLPDTECVFGRPGNPASHFLYRVTGVNKSPSKKFTTAQGEMVVELLGDGKISTVPPSLWMKQEPYQEYQFESGKDGLPNEVPYADLLWSVRRLAAASLILRLYPAPGLRHDTALALAGALLNSGLSVDDAKHFIRSIVKAAGDPEIEDRVTAVDTTDAKLAKNEACWGWPKLGGLLGDAGPGVVKACRKWLGAPEADPPKSFGVTPAKTLVTVKASDVVVQPVTWLWKDRIAYGAVAIIDGDPGEGKSSIALDHAARLSAGKALPGGDDYEPAGVVVVGCEDSIETTVVPRLKAAGADLARIRLVKGVPEGDGFPRMLSIPEDLGALREAIKSAGARLVVIEPLLAFISLNTHSHSDQQVRRALGPLAALAEETSAAVLAVRHLTKKPGGQPLYRGQGSIGFIGAARTAFLVGPDPHTPECRVLAMTKSNLGELERSWRYRIVGKTSPPGEEPAWSASAIEWVEECDVQANALVAEKTHSSKALHAAVEFLDDLLGGGPMMDNSVMAQAEAAGHSKSTIKRAAGELGVDKSQVHADGKIKGWQWVLPGKAGSDGGAEASDIGPPPWALTSYGKS